MSSTIVARKESPYNPFLTQVLLPGFRIGIIFLALVVIGLSTWLETNESIEDCSFRSSLSFHQIYLYRNISSNLTTPDSVSFGLWKSCYLYALNCSCTPTNLKYQPDISTLLQVATTHKAVPPVSTSSTSLAKVLPLSTAIVFCFIALLIGIWVNRWHHYQYHYRVSTKRWVVYPKLTATILLLLAAILSAYVFGSTYTSYFNQIKHVCQDPNNKVSCARHAIGIEVILFGITSGLLFLAFLFWFYFSKSTYNNTSSNAINEYNVNTVAYAPEDDELPDSTQSQFQQQQQHKLHQPQDELAVWRDVAMYDIQEKKTKKEKGINKWSATKQAYQNQTHMNSNGLSPLPPPPAVLTPTLPLIDNIRSSKSRLTSKDYRERKSSQHPYYISTTSPSPQYDKKTHGHFTNKHNSSHYNNYRRESDDSAFTFGNHPTPRGNNISKTRSPHPMISYYPKTTTINNRGSFCMTHYQNDSYSLGSSNSSDRAAARDSTGSLNYFDHQQHQVPILNMPPAGNCINTSFMEHPLNKKVIKDKRIQEYLQKQ
ncbi:hypothetical protein BDF20DRAFT_825011 [Mycotypha africana]|uniref:uncharacterized protein n=1 Tax=Mycotypha africana TaxID=64632 RepID=UPI00230113F4|nr:uncharacterized protein BDF20DRAFT_825011 [Mycotypha africana]KAI8971898.1 hypothetical protein BDF20DRAFT_825011 [Mycotypha africana]